MPSLNGSMPSPSGHAAFDAAAVRARLATARGPLLWRSLEELADSRAFREWLRTQQPQLADALLLDRRGFMKFMGASLALAGLAACGHPPQDQIVPYVSAPQGQIDGLPRFFATTLVREGYAHGVLVESHMGRPTKIEGNPQHPASLGATDIFAQAAVLQLWDPDRSQTVMHGGDIASWDEVAGALQELRERHAAARGAGLRILTGSSTSPTLTAQMDALRSGFPLARWHVHQAGEEVNAYSGASLSLGAPLATRLRLERARIVLSLDADFLGDPAAGVRYARDYAAGRAADAGDIATHLNSPTTSDAAIVGHRLYVVESTPSLTGGMADHRLALESQRIALFALRLAQKLGVAVASTAGGSADAQQQRWLDALTADLQANHGAALIVIGAAQPAWLHGLGHVMNAMLGSAGVTLEYSECVARLPGGSAGAGGQFPGTLVDLVRDMRAGSVDTLIMLDCNPVYDAAADLLFADALKSVPHAWHLGLYRDESGMLAEWHLPMAHALESWSDARAYDGSASIAQPLIAPLYGGRSAHEVLAAMLGEDRPDGRTLIRRQWQALLPDEASWNAALQTGLIANTRLPHRPAAARADFLASPAAAAAMSAAVLAAAPEHSALELLLRLDPTVGDGTWSNNGWLQELPKPLTQLTWDNAALVSPALAAEQKLANGDEVELRVGERALRAPVWIMPGQAKRSVTIHLGYGRRAAGRIGTGCGFDAYRLRSSSDAWSQPGLQLRKTGVRLELAGTQHHFSMEGRDLVRVATLAQNTAAGSAQHAARALPPTLYPEFPPGQYAWGMSIDLNACIGCKACTIACQAENNIPVVGKEQVQRGREMHWIRVDRYYEGSAENPRAYSQPVPCMMCEHAPCELVCPVGATLHDAEGLNVQVYNRCVGTRFCSNNCPYKVRRFNFLQYTDEAVESLAAQRNPEVTVRRRGVMEKCTYCIQRVQSAHIEADKQARRIADGEVLTACQAVCPTQAIHFGDSADPRSQVAQAKRSARNYVLLEELNTRPRTSYLSRLRNPHPLLDGDSA